MKPLVLAFAFGAGLLNAVQAGCNAALGKAIGPFLAGLVIVSVSGAVFLVVGLASGRLVWPGMERIGETPWWAWIGGIFGAIFVMAQLFTAEQLGSAVFMALTVTAAISMSLVLDHYGLFGFKQHAASWGRVAGVGLMFVGLGMIAKF